MKEYRTAAYSYGTAARTLGAEASPRRQQSRELERENARRQKPHSRAMDFPYIAACILATCVSFALIFAYIGLQSSIVATRRAIEESEKQLEFMRNENDAMENSISMAVDLDDIYRVATEELGMVYAGQNQVIRYDKTESEYVRQYEDIPGTQNR